uniref:Uncharacterized protein n=1 Tax=Panagrolaimus sp. ES5 TaxID=591445 RepID=A0AC34FH86_9BILA
MALPLNIKWLLNPPNELIKYDILISEDKPLNETIPVIEPASHWLQINIDRNGIYSVYFTKALKYEIPKNVNEITIPTMLSSYDIEVNAVGIDLGTTECCAAVIRKNGPDFVVLDEVTRLRTMPSYVSFDEENDKCGQIVVNRMRHQSKYTVYDIKRIIGKKFDEVIVDSLWPFKVVPQNENGSEVRIETKTFDNKHQLKTPEGIAAVLVKHMKTCLEAYQGQSLKSAVITIPSEFTEAQVKATATAADLAGWENIDFLPEPIAAAFAYFSEINIPKNSIITICDCGGGTVDICIAKVTKNQIKILSHAGDPYLGGRDFDKLLFNYFVQKVKDEINFDIMESDKKYVLKQKCQDIKHTLSATNEDFIDIDDFDSEKDGIIKISREKFETMATGLMDRFQAIILQTVTKANQIHYVFQVGGGCRMPMIKNILSKIFPDAKHQCNVNPDWVVAHGAALYDYHLKTNNQFGGWRLTVAKALAYVSK